MTDAIRSNNYFLIRDQSGGFQKIHLNQLLFVKSMGNYLQFVTTEGSFTTHGALHQLAASLAFKDCFLQVHRSFVVNLDMIDHIHSDNISIQKHLIPVGGSFAEIFRNNFIHQYLLKL